MGVSVTQEEHKHYCLLKCIAQLEKPERDRFFELFNKKHGAEKLEQLKSEARKLYQDLKNGNHVR